jgi:hypothetical protein
MSIAYLSGHGHTPELIMHWIDVHANPADPKTTGGLPCSSANRDQLIAVWVEQNAEGREPLH